MRFTRIGIISIVAICLSACGGNDRKASEASALCKNGTYDFSTDCSNLCAFGGGVSKVLDSCRSSDPEQPIPWDQKREKSP